MQQDWPYRFRALTNSLAADSCITHLELTATNISSVLTIKCYLLLMLSAVVVIFVFFFLHEDFVSTSKNTCTQIIVRRATRTQLSININCFLKYTHEQNVLHATCSTGMDTPLRSPSGKKVVSIMNTQWSFPATWISETDTLTSLTARNAQWMRR